MQGLGQHPAARRDAHSGPGKELLISDGPRSQGSPDQGQQRGERGAQPSVSAVHQHPPAPAARGALPRQVLLPFPQAVWFFCHEPNLAPAEHADSNMCKQCALGNCKNLSR